MKQLLFMSFAMFLLGAVTGCDALLNDSGLDTSSTPWMFSSSQSSISSSGGSTSSSASSSSSGIGSIVSQYQMDYGPYSIAIKGTYVYTARGATIHVVNIANPATPTKATEAEGAAADSPSFISLFVDGNRLYAGSGTGFMGFYIFDITNPATPVRLGAYQPSDVAWKIGPAALFADGNIVWAVGSDGSRGRIVKVDVSDPANPVRLAQHDLAGSTGSGFGGVWANATHVFADSNLGDLHAFTTADLSPVSVFKNGVDYFPVAGHEAGAYKLIGTGSTLYWCNWGAGLMAMDIADPANMALKSRVAHGAGSDSVYSVALDGTTAWIAYGHMTVLSVNAANPSSMSVLQNYDHDPRLIRDIVIYGDYAILADQGGNLYGNVPGLDIMRIR